jgi:hypothetical protein
MKNAVRISAFFIFHFTFLSLAAIPTTPGWYAIPNTTLNSVCAATHGFPEVRGVCGCGAITEAWNSGVFDTKRNRLIIWGGGHNDYYGNEIYALDLNGVTMSRITDPGLPVATSCVAAIAGGTQPNSRHTNDGIVYLEHADKMFAQGGCPACPGGGFSNDTWTFNFAASQWERKYPSGTIPKATALVSSYDPNTKKVFVHDGSALFSYTLESNTYVRHAGSSLSSAWTKTSVIDPKRRKLFVFGSGESSVWDISSGSSFSKQSFSTSNGSAVTAAYAPGLTYDPGADRIIGWGGGNTMYTLNVDTRTWTAHTYSGGPGPQVKGTYKRCGYSSASGVFVVYNETSQNGFTFRFPGSTGAQRTNITLSTKSLSVWPNPFRSKTIIHVRSKDARSKEAKIQVYDVAGNLCFLTSLPPASSEYTWHASNLPAGIYFVQVKAPGFNSVKQVLLMK